MNALVLAAIGLVAATGIPYAAYLGLYAWVRPEGSPADKADVEPTVSVVLPTYNEASIVEQKLEDICSLDYPQEKMEVVVVDSSDDETPNLVQSFFADRSAPALRFIRESERRGLAPALNDAYAAATNEVVVKTDCDSFLSEDALREAVANLADPEVAAVTGRNTEVLGGSDVERSYRDVQAYVQQLESHLDSTFIFHGPLSAFERNAIVQIDQNSLADDTELALRIRCNGGHVVFDPAVRYKEAAHSEFGKRRTQKDRRAMGLIRLLVQQRDALGRHGNYGRIVLPFNWWFMVLSPWFVVASLLAVSSAAILLAGPIGVTVPAAIVAFGWLGQRDSLGPFQPLYSLLDTQVSLLGAAVRLVTGNPDGMWAVDVELREAYD